MRKKKGYLKRLKIRDIKDKSTEQSRSKSKSDLWMNLKELDQEREVSRIEYLRNKISIKIMNTPMTDFNRRRR